MARGPALALLLAGCGRLSFEPTTECPTPEAPELVIENIPKKFVAPTGSNTNAGTEESPWGTIAYALANAAAGEHIMLLDGAYTELLLLDVDDRTVRAVNDGGAIFDGGGTSVPCSVQGNRITLEGVHCRNGDQTVVAIRTSTDVTVRRVTAHSAPSNAVFRVSANSADVVLEDVAAWGPASNHFLVGNSTRVTLRRCWARWENSDDMYSSVLVLADNTFDATVENCIVMSTAPYDAVKSTVGFNVNSTSQRIDRSRFFGNIAYGIPNWGAVVQTEVSRIEDNRWFDTVLMRSGAGFFQRTDASFAVERLTSVELVGAGSFVVDAHSTEPKDGDFEIAGYVRDSVLGIAPMGFSVTPTYVTSFTHTNNTLFDLATPYNGAVTPDPSETIAQPFFDKDRYGLGAYLMRNELGTGAEVLYRTVDGVLGEVPLWPWPLEERILAESGTSVTWESGGGLWRELPDELVPDDNCP